MQSIHCYMYKVYALQQNCQLPIASTKSEKFNIYMNPRGSLLFYFLLIYIALKGRGYQ